MPSIFAYPRHLLKPFAKGGALASGGTSAPMRHRLSRGRNSVDLDALTKRIILPSLPVADEDLARLRQWERGRSLARQDDWGKLAELMTLADDARLTTPGGADEATLLALGAQSDALAAVVDALADHHLPDPSGINALDNVVEEYPDTPAVAMVVALAHLNIGRAWVAAPSEMLSVSSPHRTHFKRAEALLSPYDAEDLDAPSLAAVQAGLAEILCPDLACVAKSYDRLLRIDPENITHIRACGRALMHGLADDPSFLLKKADEIVENTRDYFGDAAYFWVHLDVIGQSDEALSVLDTERFSAALQAVLNHGVDQHLINQLAAFCAIDMAPRGKADSRALSRKRAALHSNLDDILSNHLAELHPMVWSGTSARPVAAPRDTAPRALVAQGRRTALRVIAQRFADQMTDGSSIAFSPAGMYRLPAI